MVRNIFNKFVIIGILLIILAFVLVADPIPFDEFIAGIAGLWFIIKGLL